jgi:hypothetical protein
MKRPHAYKRSAKRSADVTADLPNDGNRSGTPRVRTPRIRTPRIRTFACTVAVFRSDAAGRVT